MYLERQGVPASTRTTTAYRLLGLTKVESRRLLSDFTSKRAAAAYARYSETHKPATHHGALKEAKVWGEWCRKQGWIKVNPWLDVERTGRRSRGKPQHRIDDAATLYAWLKEHAPYDDGACAVLMGLLLGLRASGIVSRTVAHLDDRGRVLWVPRGKHETKAGEMPVRLPHILSDALLARTETADGPKKRNELLIPRSRWWVRRQTQRACELAGVPVVTTHALRGSTATLALEAGETAEKVAQHLGHADKGKLARGTYAQAGAGHSAQVEKVEKRLKGAGKEPPSTVSHHRPRETTPPKEE